MSSNAEPTTTVRAAGRSLADFEPLLKSEANFKKVIVEGGIECNLGGLPAHGDEDRRVRADFLRFVLLGGDPDAGFPVENPVDLVGAWVDGELYLNWAQIPFQVVLRDCVLDWISAFDAEIGLLALIGCHLRFGLVAQRLRCPGGIFLRKGFRSDYPVDLAGVIIGDFDGSGGSFINPCKVDGQEAAHAEPLVVAIARKRLALRPDPGPAAPTVTAQDRAEAIERLKRPALALERATIAAVSLSGSTVEGEARFETIKAASFDARDANITRPRNIAISLADSQIVGLVRLGAEPVAAPPPGPVPSPRDTAPLSRPTIAGTATLLGARLGMLICDGLTMTDPGVSPGPGNRVVSLDLTITQVTGLFRIYAASSISGWIDLTQAHVGGLQVVPSNWAGPWWFILDGFSYDRLLGAGSGDHHQAAISWLKRQPKEHNDTELRPQPWTQLIVVLRASGHARDAKRVARAFEERRRAANKVVGNLIGRRLHWLYGRLLDYGYHPEWLLGWLLIIWLAWAGLYYVALRPAWLGSTTPLIASAKSPDQTECHFARAMGKRIKPCEAPPPSASDLTGFWPMAYSFDTVLPVIGVGYAAKWEPVTADAAHQPLFWGWVLQLLIWSERLIGYVLGALGALNLGSRLIKQE